MFEDTWKNERYCHWYDFEMIVMRHVDIMLPAELTPAFVPDSEEECPPRKIPKRAGHTYDV